MDARTRRDGRAKEHSGVFHPTAEGLRWTVRTHLTYGFEASLQALRQSVPDYGIALLAQPVASVQDIPPFASETTVVVEVEPHLFNMNVGQQSANLDIDVFWQKPRQHEHLVIAGDAVLLCAVASAVPISKSFEFLRNLIL